ncbi:hypothetical protein Clim_1159 [Chlorobium limicola DSM 245]|uniref:Uncharacterized protein n=1 Tax=Chlorobium limicola (strain DSM 245 / NBRC 103803 / 6330) TaxID=290315 RepID=B3ECF3_CHLL2|nr:hypothetical protein Clim_1159 [Chlorobium limicola DSM 245]
MAELRDGEDELLFFLADQLISYQAGWSGSRLSEAMRREKNVGGRPLEGIQRASADSGEKCLFLESLLPSCPGDLSLEVCVRHFGPCVAVRGWLVV